MKWYIFACPHKIEVYPNVSDMIRCAKGMCQILGQGRMPDLGDMPGTRWEKKWEKLVLLP